MMLLAELKDHGYAATGTIRDNRVPKGCSLTSKKVMAKQKRGSYESLLCDDEQNSADSIGGQQCRNSCINWSRSPASVECPKIFLNRNEGGDGAPADGGWREQQVHGCD